MKQSTNIYSEYLFTNNKLSRKTTLRRSTISKIRQKHSPWKLYLLTNDINFYNKYRKISDQIRLSTRQSSPNLGKKIFVMILKIILKKIGSVLTKEKPM